MNEGASQLTLDGCELTFTGTMTLRVATATFANVLHLAGGVTVAGGTALSVAAGATLSFGADGFIVQSNGHVDITDTTLSFAAPQAGGACVVKEGGDVGEKTDPEAGQACFADATCLAILMSSADACTSTAAGGTCHLLTAGAVPSAATCTAADDTIMCIVMSGDGSDPTANSLCEKDTCSFSAGTTDAAMGTACNGNAKCKTLLSCSCSGTNTKDAKTATLCSKLTTGPAPAASGAGVAAVSAAAAALIANLV